MTVRRISSGARVRGWFRPFRVFCQNLVSLLAAHLLVSISLIAAAEAPQAVILAPDIQVDPISMDLGAVPVSGNFSDALIIANTGTTPLNISDITVSGTEFLLGGFVLPLSLDPGQGTAITVTFQPSVVGIATDMISIVSDASPDPTLVPLRGTGIAATFPLTANPTSLSFGEVPIGTLSALQDVTLTNIGDSDLTIRDITVNGVGYSFTGGLTPVTLAPSESLVLGVQFNPAELGTTDGYISIVSDVSGTPTIVSLSGTGVVPVQHSVELNWTETSEVSGFNIYRSTVSGSGYVKLNSTLVAELTYMDSDVENGATYYYVVTAVDSSDVESDYSEEVEAAIPDENLTRVPALFAPYNPIHNRVPSEFP